MRTAIIVLVALWPLAAIAGTEPDARQEARAAYLKARARYNQGKYPEAVVELKRAYSLKHFSVLLRYIGDSYYAMKKYRLALDYYRSYLDRARHAQDKTQVGLRIRELEESLSSEEPATAPGGGRAKLPQRLVPDGRDGEVPVTLRRETTAPDYEQTTRHRVLKVAKWSALGIGVASLALGLTYNLLGRSKARELEQSVRTACPDGSSTCRGNPDLAHPVSAFSEQQFQLEQTYERYQNRSIGFFVAAGAAAATSVVLFIVDRPGRATSTERRVSVVPALGPGTCGIWGEVTF